MRTYEMIFLTKYVNEVANKLEAISTATQPVSRQEIVELVEKVKIIKQTILELEWNLKGVEL
jgi:hypothetical protein